MDMLGRLVDAITSRLPDEWAAGCMILIVLAMILPGIVLAVGMFVGGWGFFGGLWR